MSSEIWGILRSFRDTLIRYLETVVIVISIHSFFDGFQYSPRYFLGTVLHSSSAISLLKNVFQSFLITTNTRNSPKYQIMIISKTLEPSSAAPFYYCKIIKHFAQMIQNRFDFQIRLRDVQRVSEIFRNVLSYLDHFCELRLFNSYV